MRTLRLVTSNNKLIRVDSVRCYDLKVSNKNTSIDIATNNDYHHNIYEFKFASRVKYMEEFYDGRRKGLFDISNWFGRCWISAYRHIHSKSLSNLEDD